MGESQPGLPPCDYLIKTLVKAKSVDGRRALPQYELVRKSCWYCGTGPLEDALNSGLRDGTFKLTAGGKVSLGPGKREMRRAIGANGFERLLDLSSDVLADVLSFSDLSTLAACEAASRRLSAHTARAWQTLTLSQYPMLRLLVDDVHLDLSKWRGVYRRTMERFLRGVVGTVIPPHSPPLSEYKFVFELWTGEPEDKNSCLIECGTWDLGTDHRTYDGVHLIKPLASLSAWALRCLEDGTYLRSVISKRNSNELQSVPIYDGSLDSDVHRRFTYFMNVREPYDEICGSPQYEHLYRKSASPTPVVTAVLPSEISTINVNETIEGDLVMRFAWQDDREDFDEEDESVPMAVSHLERLLDRYVEWF